MFDLKLFLGFYADPDLQEALNQANPYLHSLFIGKEEYIQRVHSQEKEFLGKYLPSFPSYEQLEDIEKHLVSLLQRLAPHYPFSKNPPVLVTLSNGNG